MSVYQGMPRISPVEPPIGESPSRTNSRQDSVMTNVSDARRTTKMQRGLSIATQSGLSGSVGGGIYASSLDLTTNMAKNDYFRWATTLVYQTLKLIIVIYEFILFTLLVFKCLLFLKISLISTYGKTNGNKIGLFAYTLTDLI